MKPSALATQSASGSHPDVQPGPAAEISPLRARGDWVEIDGEAFYRIAHVDAMPPFLINLVSSTDLWMFIASNGALTAGRRDADNALFPYVTQDKLFDSAHVSGGVTAMWLESPDTTPDLWEPFAGRRARGGFERHLYKNALGSVVIFEEIHRAQQLAFRCAYSFSPEFGLVRATSIQNAGIAEATIRAVDGLQNLLPYGIDQAFVNQFSNLADAYKKSELLVAERLAVYYLSSIPTDRAEPSEGLKATIAWVPDAECRALLLSSDQLTQFRRGEDVVAETDCRGRRGAFLCERRFSLAPGAEKRWTIVADVSKDALKIERLRARIAAADPAELERIVAADVARNAAALRCKIASVDGWQRTGHRMADARHCSNALFNAMRGGLFANAYQIDRDDFAAYLRNANAELSRETESQLATWESEISLWDLQARAAASGDLRMIRLAREYLPLTFSRRHGDPSRPWNRFSIRTQDEEGRPILAYQGNWRDIFQNWEPLGYSHPGYIEGMIARFLNASTADGYNPYRISRDGFDWETIEPDQPWSNIGYWGDHQIIYLLKLLEAFERFFPGRLAERWSDCSFVYAHVPYRIRSFDAMLADPRSTVDYDEAAAETLRRRASELGADGKLLRREDGEIVSANLMEKLLVPLLSKLSNFVPDGGIWMNTQRPEWNDANNALVGNGVSVVTLCYVRRYIDFLLRQTEEMEAAETIGLARVVAVLLRDQAQIFDSFYPSSEDGYDASVRFKMMQQLGQSGTAFREVLYKRGFDRETVGISLRELRAFLGSAQRHVVASIASNRRGDGMFHSYNLLALNLPAEQAALERLPEMLEGQVAALSSGQLSPAAAVDLLRALRRSALYRSDVGSYLLYPDRALPTFLEKNRFAEASARRIPLLASMLDRGDRRLLARDVAGNCRFNADFRNSKDLRRALAKIHSSSDYPEMDVAAIEACAHLFDTVFDHRRFTGRSGSFFAYEGLGSVYWHMVSKLILAIQENCLKATGSPAADELAAAYFETLAGLGLGKSPAEYGAFPLDAYSHTPRHAGAQQPGMTGQVKEDLLIRWGQLGLQVERGTIVFRPVLLRSQEFLQVSSEFRYIDAKGGETVEPLQAGELAFTFCQALFVVAQAATDGVRVEFADGSRSVRPGAALSPDESAAIFERDGRIRKVVFEWKG